MRRFLVKFLMLSILILLADRGVGALLMKGLDRYYGFDRNAEILLVGNSHTVLGIDSTVLEDVIKRPVAKFAVCGTNVVDRLVMLRHYFSMNPSSVKIVIIDVDDFTFSSNNLHSNAFTQFYPFMDIPVWQEYIRSRSGSNDEYNKKKYLWSTRFNDQALNSAVRGLLGLRDSIRTGRVDINQLKGNLEKIKKPQGTGIIDQRRIEAFDEMVQFVRSQGAVLVICYLPIVDAVLLPGPDHTRVMDIYRRYEQQDAGIKFLDFQSTYGNKYELFNDHEHLNRDGQKRITSELGLFLKNNVTAF